MIPLLTCLAFVLSVPDMSPIEDAIWAVESNRCQSGCPKGDSQNARGPLQIWRGAWSDCKRNDETYEMCESLEYSLKIFRRYCERYLTVKRLGRVATDEDRAKLWNGGPNFFRTKSQKKLDNLARYWAKVKKELDENEG